MKRGFRRRMRAEEVAELSDGEKVAIKRDPHYDRRGTSTRHYRVSTLMGLKVLTECHTHFIKTIKDEPGFYFCREGGYK